MKVANAPRLTDAESVQMAPVKRELFFISLCGKPHFESLSFCKTSFHTKYNAITQS